MSKTQGIWFRALWVVMWAVAVQTDTEIILVGLSAPVLPSWGTPTKAHLHQHGVHLGFPQSSPLDVFSDQGTGDMAQLVDSFLACIKSWVQSTALHTLDTVASPGILGWWGQEDPLIADTANLRPVWAP